MKLIFKVLALPLALVAKVLEIAHSLVLAIHDKVAALADDKPAA